MHSQSLFRYFHRNGPLLTRRSTSETVNSAADGYYLPRWSTPNKRYLTVGTTAQIAALNLATFCHILPKSGFVVS